MRAEALCPLVALAGHCHGALDVLLSCTVSPCLSISRSAAAPASPELQFIAPPLSLSGNHVRFPEETDLWEGLEGRRGDNREQGGLTESPTPWTQQSEQKADGEGQGSLRYCRPRGHKELGADERLS